MSVVGTRDLTISTPIGRVKAIVELRREQGVLTGSAHGAGEQVPLHDLVLDGDHLTGTSKAGRLPSSKVLGQRRPAADAR
jgi:hypothetical protein